MPILGRPIKGQSNDLRQNKMPLLSGLSIYDFGRLISTIIFLMIGQVIKLLLVMIPVRFQLYLDQFHEKIYPSHFLRSKSDERSLHPLANITTFEQMADYWGANYEQHIVRTSDGYFLTLHRLCPDPQSTSKFDQSKVVLFFHGFMMTSEGWLAHPIRSSNLALNLLDKGYDVWLANVRGNKYGIKHKKFKFTDSEFWDFSLDEVALIDLPETVDYVLHRTGSEKLSYIGFSQGTTICFAALSMFPELRDKINCFIALAPSMKPYGLSNSLISSIMKSTPNLIYLIFGRKSLLPTVSVFMEAFAPRFFVSLIDKAVGFLFNWRGKSMSLETKVTAYQHLYSVCSVKLMVHWFQIIRNQRFAMFDEELDRKFGDGAEFGSSEKSYSSNSVIYLGLPNQNITRRPSSRFPQVAHLTPRFPTEQISYPPIAAFYGGKDTLLDMKFLVRGLRSRVGEIPMFLDDKWVTDEDDAVVVADNIKQYSDSKKSAASPLVFLKCVPSYEHLCFLWGDKLKELIHDDVYRILESFG